MEYRLWIGWLGSLVLIAGAATVVQGRKHTLFALGNACTFTYAFLGYLQGGPVFFFILQIFIALATLCMLLKVPEISTTPILVMSGLFLVVWSLASFQGYTTVMFVVGLVTVGIGYALHAGTVRREMAFTLGSAVIALFSFLMRDWVFFSLNFLFAVLSLRNVVRLRYSFRSILHQ